MVQVILAPPGWRGKFSDRRSQRTCSSDAASNAAQQALMAADEHSAGAAELQQLLEMWAPADDRHLNV